MEKAKISLAQARDTAAGLIDLVGGCCERIEIAGSVRRQLREVRDLELVAIPRIMDEPNLLFSDKKVSALAWRIDQLLKQQPSSLKLDTETPRNGDKYKRLIFGGVCVDLFIVTRETWGPQFAVRTGPAAFSQLLVTHRCKGGAMPDDHRLDGGLVHGPHGVVATLEEPDFFEVIGVPCWPPAERTDGRLTVHLKHQQRKESQC